MDTPDSEDAVDGCIEFELILGEYKKVLKARGITYKEIADKLGLSEAAIKKALSSDDASVSRIADLCRAADISYFELMRLADKNQEKRIELSAAQEDFLTKDLKCFKFFMALLEQPLEAIAKQHGLSEAQLGEYLDKLKSIGLLARKEGLGYKLLVQGKLVKWSPSGPFARLHNRRISTAFIEKIYEEFDKEGTFRKRASVQMTAETAGELIARLGSVSDEFASRARREMATTKSSDLVDMTWVIGVGPFDVWAFLLGDVKL